MIFSLRFKFSFIAIPLTIIMQDCVSSCASQFIHCVYWYTGSFCHVLMHDAVCKFHIIKLLAS